MFVCLFVCVFFLGGGLLSEFYSIGGGGGSGETGGYCRNCIRYPLVRTSNSFCSLRYQRRPPRKEGGFHVPLFPKKNVLLFPCSLKAPFSIVVFNLP